MGHARKMVIVLVLPLVLVAAACGADGGGSGSEDLPGVQRVSAGGPPVDGGASSDHAQRNWQHIPD